MIAGCPKVRPPAGVMTATELEQLRPVNVSMGLMLENVSPRLRARGGPHHAAPDKDPAVRLRTITDAGRLRILATAVPRRAGRHPDVPSSAEAGFPALNVSTWWALVGPRGMPKAAVDRIYETVQAALRDTAVLAIEVDLMAPGAQQEMIAAMAAA